MESRGITAAVADAARAARTVNLKSMVVVLKMCGLEGGSVELMMLDDDFSKWPRNTSYI